MQEEDSEAKGTSMVAFVMPILRHPRATMRTLIVEHPQSGVMVLPLLMGLLTAVPTVFSVEAMYTVNPVILWVGSIVLSIIGYWMYVYVYGGVYRMIGGWFGAAGNASATRLALAWTQVPYILAGLVMVPLRVIYRDDFFSTSVNTTDSESAEGILVYESGDDFSFQIFDNAFSGFGIGIVPGFATTEVNTAFWVITFTGYLVAMIAFFWSNFLLAEALECSTWKALAVKLTAFGLHIPIFAVLFVLAIILAVAFAMLTTM